MSSPHILVIDDNAVVRVALEQLLTLHGYTVVPHDRAAGVLAMVLATQTALVITDLHLEERAAGLAVVRALRADPRTAAIPILLWSADPYLDAWVARLDAPNVLALSKYADAAILLTFVKRLTAAHGHPPSAP